MAAPFYRFFPGDYMRDTRFLSMMQHGAYRLLIDEYMSNGPLPDDLTRLYRICGAQSVEERAAVEFVLVEFFVKDGPRWVHTRCEKELSYQQDRSYKAKESADRRWKGLQKEAPTEESDTDANAYANALRTDMRTQCDGNANQNQNKEKKENTAHARGARSGVALPDWLAPDVWADWCDYRRSLRKGWTLKAQELNLARLAELRDEGYEPREVVNFAISSGWQALYPPKGVRAGKVTADPFQGML